MQKTWVSAMLSICIGASAFALQRQVSDAELSIQADVIILGTVADVQFARSNGDYNVLTHLTLDVSRNIKGAEKTQIQITLPGGIWGEFSVDVSDTPDLKVGDRAIFFLYEKKGYDHPWIFGWNQGALLVEEDLVLERNMSVDEMCARIRAFIP